MSAVNNPQDTLTSRFEHTTDDGAQDILVVGSQFFRRFVVQIVGVQVGTQISVKASLDNVNFPVIFDGTTTLEMPVTAAGAGVIVQFELQAPMRGGLKIAFPNNTADGVVTVDMYDNPSYIARRRN